MSQKYKPDFDSRGGNEISQGHNFEPWLREKHAFNIRQLRQIHSIFVQASKGLGSFMPLVVKYIPNL